jgi:hypothetical protein
MKLIADRRIFGRGERESEFIEPRQNLKSPKGRHVDVTPSLQFNGILFVEQAPTVSSVLPSSLYVSK